MRHQNETKTMPVYIFAPGYAGAYMAISEGPITQDDIPVTCNDFKDVSLIRTNNQDVPSHSAPYRDFERREYNLDIEM